MHVLVTGHRGYIGAVIVPILVARGHQVVGIDSDLYGDSSFGERLVQIPEFKLDIRDIDYTHLLGVDAIIHLAALSNDPLGNLSPELTYEINHHASVRLAIMAKKLKIRRFLFSSSCSTYGAADDDYMNEESALNPVTHYGRSKVLVEQDVGKLADDTFSPTFLRNATVYGVSPKFRIDLVLNNLVGWAHTSGRVLLKSDGSPWRPLIHVEDVARAFVCMLEAPISTIHNQAFNVAPPGENYRIRDLAELIEKKVPRCRIELAENAGPDKRNYRVDCRKVQESLSGYQPRWQVSRGIDELYDAYLKHDLNPEDLESERFNRINSIESLIRQNKLDQQLRWLSTIESGQLERTSGK